MPTIRERLCATREGAIAFVKEGAVLAATEAIAEAMAEQNVSKEELAKLLGMKPAVVTVY